MPKRESERHRSTLYVRLPAQLKKELYAELDLADLTMKQALIFFAESFITAARAKRGGHVSEK